MNDLGFLRVAAAVPVTRVASAGHNAAEMCSLLDKASEKDVAIVVFPELSITGSTCGDLFFNAHLIYEAEKGISAIAAYTLEKDMVIVAGAPVPVSGRLYDCAIVIKQGKVTGIVPKTCISSQQARWFSSGDCIQHDLEIAYAGQNCLISPYLQFSLGKALIGIGIGEDVSAVLAPASFQSAAGAQVIINPSASNELVLSDRRRRGLFETLSTQNTCAYIHSSAGFGESTQDMVYAGCACIWENGDLLSRNERFQTESSLTIADIDIERLDLLRRRAGATAESATYGIIDLGENIRCDFGKELFRHIESSPFLPSGDKDLRCSEVLSLQTMGLVSRLNHIGCRCAIIGISGGLDSTLALLVAVMAFDKLGWSRERIIGVTMPGFGTTSRTRNNAWDLMEQLGITCREISIKAACEQHFTDLGHDSSVHDATYENSQARERTQILMDLANKEGGIVIGTGDLSELALGWATYNGDHMSMYGVNADIPKTLVRSLVRWAAENRFNDADVRNILLDIVATPISPELLPANDKGEIQQVTEDLVGPYELHDFFLYNFVRNGFRPEKIFFLARKAFENKYSEEVIKKWLKTFFRRFFNQQFKRSCMPDGPKVGSVGLSPRGDWQMPSDAWSSTYLEETDNL